MRVIIDIGSMSGIKIDAVRTACDRSRLDATVRARAVASGVPVQPVGRDETLRGARNRAAGARRAGAWSVGIENGIVGVDGRWEDIAAVVVISPDGIETVEWSEALVLPDEHVAEARARGFGHATVGGIIAAARGGSADDPHRTLTGGRSCRKDILARAAQAALSRAMEATMKDRHHIVIRGVVRDLPVREVAPGVRVALFNILGDWELAEAAGRELAARLPEGVDALVMPDGKATALLHVTGREARLPTYVARKEKKPYMAEPVRSHVYRSITTAKEQALHLGADDAAALAGKRVVIVDDVVSTGGTIEAMKTLLAAVGAEVAAVAAVLTEGERRPDVIALGHLPLF